MTDKIVIGDTSRVGQFELLRDWWQTDGPDWVRTRENEWRILKKNKFIQSCSAQDRKLHEAYYLRGEPYPDRHRTLSHAERFAFTPYRDADQAQTLFLHFHPSAMETLIVGYAHLAAQALEGLEDRRLRIQHFVQGVLGDRFRILVVKGKHEETVVTPNPVWYVDQWCGYASLFLEGRSKADYDTCVDTVPWLFSMLEHVDQLGEPISERFTMLKTLADEVEQYFDLSPVQAEFRAEFLAQCDRDDLPPSVLAALARKE